MKKYSRILLPSPVRSPEGWSRPPLGTPHQPDRVMAQWVSSEVNAQGEQPPALGPLTRPLPGEIRLGVHSGPGLTPVRPWSAMSMV